MSTRIVNLSNNTLPLVHQTLFYPQADVVVDDSHERVIGEKSDEGDLLLAEGFLQNGPSRSSVGGFPAGFGGREFLFLSFHSHRAKTIAATTHMSNLETYTHTKSNHDFPDSRTK